VSFTASHAASEISPLRVLVAEDEFLVGSILEENLRDSGYEVVGVLQTLATLREAVNAVTFDVAILDVNLAGEMVFPVAEELRTRGKPFILVTGYGARNLPQSLKDAHILGKPCAFSEIEKAMLQVWETKARSPSLVQPEGVASRSGAEPQVQRAAVTLGDVLYAKSPITVREEEWVDLIKGIARGDQLALHGLYERAHRVVYTLLVRLTASREASEQLTVDVFYDIWRRAADYDAANGPVLGWIMNQARSRAIDRIRVENRKEGRQPSDDIAGHAREVIEFREQDRALKAALSVLTPEERRAIETTYFGELTHAEAAALLNQPLGTIKTRIRSALYKLIAAMSAEAGSL
jgi:RNA polymerase sigma-70 factor (ECF subfamily)